MKRSAHICLIAGVLSLVSCSTFKKVGDRSSTLVHSTASAASSGFGALADLMPGRGIKVVKVREKDLRELPTGQEKALAYQSTRRSGFWIFGGPVNFSEPALPDAGTEPDGTLLPPKVQ